jgi:hypothetical protein
MDWRRPARAIRAARGALQLLRKRQPSTPSIDDRRVAALARARTFPTVTTEVAGLVIGCSRAEVVHLIERGDLDAFKAGKNRKVKSSSLLKLVGLDG